MAKAAKEIQMENPKELETQSAGTTCSPSEEQAEKPSMLCFKKRKKSCKKGLTSKDACEGASAASEEKSQCIGTDQGEAKVSAQPRSSRGAWAAIKSLTRPRRRQKSSSRKKVPSDSQVQLEIDAEEGCKQGFPRKKASSGVKMPCVRFSRGKKKRSPSEVVEESEGSVQANEEMGISNKAIEEPEELAPAEEPSRAEPSSPLPAEKDQEDKGTVEEGADAGRKSEPLAESRPDLDEHAEHTTQSQITSSEAAEEHAEHTTQSEITSSVAVDEHAEHTTQSQITSSEAAEEHAEHTTQLEITSSEAADEQAEHTTQLEITSSEAAEEHAEHTTQLEITSSEAVDEHAEHTTQSEITSSVAVDEPVQEQLPEGSPQQTAVHVEEREVPAEAPVSTEQPNSTPEITEVQEIANICKELPEGDESERNTNLPEECKAEEIVMDFSQSAFKDEAASVQSSSSHQEKPEVNMGTCVGIVITVTEAVDSDNDDSDQDYEPTLVLHHNKQKGNKKSSGSFDFGQKEGPEAGSSALAEEKGLGDQGHRTSDQYELLLIETASSLVKAAIQSSIEQLVNEMALEQNKHNSFL